MPRTTNIVRRSTTVHTEASTVKNRTPSGIPADEVYHERVFLSSLFWLNLA
jgi:hypothetical protein